MDRRHFLEPPFTRTDAAAGWPHTCRKFRIAPLIRRESAAIPAMPSPWSLSCLRDVDGAAPCTQFEPQHGADASGWELCRIILDPGNVVTTDGVATGHELHETCKPHQPSAIRRYSFSGVDQFRYVELVEIVREERKVHSE